jgi:hypothetical protein
MPEIELRLGILIMVSLATCLLIWAGRHFVEVKRHQALATTSNIANAHESNVSSDASASPVCILSFSSENCTQCHQLQAPALRRVLEACGNSVTIKEVDAIADQQLVKNYHILTVPSTVVLDSAGNAHAVNYGFANTQRLLTQVNEVLAQTKQE